MFPFRDHNPSEKTPYVTYALIAANILIFISYWHLFADERALFRFYFDWALIPENVADGRNLSGLVTSMFLHGGLMHLGGNMLFLWIYGDNLEEDMGHAGFLLFYLVCGVGAGLVHVLAAPWSTVPTVGTSGAIAGVMGGYLLLYPRARVDVFFFFLVFFKIWPIRAWIVLGVWFVLQVLGGLGSSMEGGGVAYWAHIGGFVLGVLCVLPLWARRGGQSFWARTGGHPDHPETKYRLSQSRIPIAGRRR
ncbi:rhomboid family serine protease [Candidatus Rhodobacter oscarellae]|uniref:Rhomboid family serine protease n=1 Tax=Candidatus Rhodobacter oscarellae TaxID=1675527 RepID=A0A0J9E6I3_9RHOB|nr:rhomboid family intramembrane serine protease [Candidatus Rhodobacter lobularis]KMW58281.1 rhomboid family serine protease [Candidatus Rhodobacter lobularis]